MQLYSIYTNICQMKIICILNGNLNQSTSAIVGLTIETTDGNVYKTNADILKKGNTCALTFDFGGNCIIAGKLSKIIQIGTIPEGFRPTGSCIYTVTDLLGNLYFLRLFDSGHISLQTMFVQNQSPTYFTTTIIYM